MSRSDIFEIEQGQNFQYVSGENASKSADHLYEKADQESNVEQVSKSLKSDVTSRSHSSSSKKVYFCSAENCGKGYSTKGNLKTHQMKHAQLMPFRCNYENCEKSYSDRCRLKTHLRTHTQDHPFKCQYCEKRFNENGNLKTHVRVHTAERPYTCQFEDCKARFKAKGHLVDHQLTHLKIKPFKCEICKKCFTRSSTLKLHKKKTHEAKKSYKCDFYLCRKTFGDRNGLSSHLSKMHGCDENLEDMRIKLKDRSTLSDSPKKINVCNVNDNFEEIAKVALFPENDNSIKFTFSLQEEESNNSDEINFVFKNNTNINKPIIESADDYFNNLYE